MIDTLSSSTVAILAGSPLNLNCTSRGSPPDTFTWRKDGGSILQSITNQVTYTRTSAMFRLDYSIDSVTTSDSGYCQAYIHYASHFEQLYEEFSYPQSPILL